MGVTPKGKAEASSDMKEASSLPEQRFRAAHYFSSLESAFFGHGELGVIALREGNVEVAAHWLTRAIRTFLETNDDHEAARNAKKIHTFFDNASLEDQQKMKTIWQEAGIGPFPTQDES